jgi:hypothetical protein
MGFALGMRYAFMKGLASEASGFDCMHALVLSSHGRLRHSYKLSC